MDNFQVFKNSRDYSKPRDSRGINQATRIEMVNICVK